MECGVVIACTYWVIGLMIYACQVDKWMCGASGVRSRKPISISIGIEDRGAGARRQVKKYRIS